MKTVDNGSRAKEDLTRVQERKVVRFSAANNSWLNLIIPCPPKAAMSARAPSLLICDAPSGAQQVA